MYRIRLKICLYSHYYLFNSDLSLKTSELNYKQKTEAHFTANLGHTCQTTVRVFITSNIGYYICQGFCQGS